MTAIKVPKVPALIAPLCFECPPLNGSRGNPMRHCDRQQGHGGLHSWEAFDDLETLRGQLRACRTAIQKLTELKNAWQQAARDFTHANPDDVQDRGRVAVEALERHAAQVEAVLATLSP